MTLYLVVAACLSIGGLTLVLSGLRWFARRPLVERLAPYLPGGAAAVTRSTVFSVASFADVLGPLAELVGSRLARLFGVREPLDRRLARAHADRSSVEVRMQQLTWAAIGGGVGLVVAAVTRPTGPVAVAVTLVPAVLGMLIVEERVNRASERFKRSVRRELPVVAEQIGMLLGAGFSLGASLERIARRGHGAAAQDLARVLTRVRQGVMTEEALREWAELVEVDAVDRLVAVLALDREAGDLGPLIAAEARLLRADVQRELITTIERRGQQVWVPVTVAALLPGAIFIGVPFLSALRELLA